MYEGHPEFLRNLCKIGRHWLSDSLVVRSVVHNAANALPGDKLQIMLEQLPADINLRRQLERPYLQVVLPQFLNLAFRRELILH